MATSKDLTNNQESKYHYNDNDQLNKKQIKNSAGTVISEENFTYDEIGRLTDDTCIYDKSNSKSVKTALLYEKAVDHPLVDNKVNRYLYYLDNATSPIAQTGYGFDSFNRITSKFCAINGKEFAKHITYDKTRPRQLLEMLNGRPLSNINYEYDVMGRISSINDVDYTYDTYGQLVEEKNNTLDKTIQYVYNGIGNIVSVTKRTGNSTGSTTTFGYDAAHPDRLTSYNGKTITYNANGGIDSYDGWDYSWSKGKLSSISKTSNARALKPNLSPRKTYSFTYNALGQRVTSTYSHFWLDGALVPIQSGEVINYTKQYKYDHAGRLIAEVVNGEKYEMGSFSKTLRYLYDESAIVGVQYTNGANTNAYYFLKNLQGDVIEIYDTAGAKVVSYSYDAWGNCTIDSSTTNYDLAHDNPIRYRGYYYDEDTKLYYLNARYYSPEFRRFISPDDTAYLDPKNVNGLNLYCYCNNDPVDNIFASEQINFLSTNQGSPIGNILKESESIHHNKSLPKLSWLASNSTSVYGVLSALNAGVPIATHYFKYASIINDEFRLYGISKFRTSLQLSNINLKITGLDGALIGVNVALDMYDSIQRGTSAEGVLLGGALTAVSGVGMFYLNKGIMWSFTTLGTAICPGLGTGIGFASGLVLSILVDILLGEKLNRWIDEIAV